MPRFLFAATPAAGHVNPMLPVARELVARGHRVAWYTSERYREAVESAGACHLPMVEARDIDVSALDRELPGRADTRGLDRFRFDLRELFIPAVPGQVADLTAHRHRFAPDVIVAEPSLGPAARVMDVRHDIPWATLGISALAIDSADTAPFGLGLQPPRTVAGRLRNAVLRAAVRRTVFREADRAFDAMLQTLDAPSVAGGLFAAGISPYLMLQPTVPSFEYPRRDLPSHVHFIGPSLPAAPAAGDLPPWWDDLAGGRRVVLVTQGTIATDPTELLRPTLDGLADEDVLVVAVTGGAHPAVLGPLPANARAARHVPFAALMPHVDAMVTNGGYGGLHYALAHGVPVVVAGATEEKPELVARVNWSGVGIGMREQRNQPAALRVAVRRVLDDPRFAARARAMAAEMAEHDGPRDAAALLERLAATRGVVERDAAYAALAVGTASAAPAGVSV